jgi:hypothetical protein
MSTFFAQKKEQQQQQQEQQTKSNTAEAECLKDALWNKYAVEAGKFLVMKSDPTMLPLLLNLSIRIRELELQCGIPEERSITNGIPGIPAIVLVSVGGGNTAINSDVTSNK